MRSQIKTGLTIVCLLVGLTSCAVTRPPVVDHAFGFNAIRDSPDIEILDYRYGSREPDSARYREGDHVPQRGGIRGPFRRGNSLYVKWRIKSTGEIHENVVNLKSRLPTDITQQEIYFVIKGAQLYVYLISPERRPADWPPAGPKGYDYLKVFTVYPDKKTLPNQND